MSVHFDRAFVFGDGINTDVLAPGIYKHPTATIAQHCLESVGGRLSSTVRPDPATATRW
jgi:3-isopropylmalate/(R)-2-methylmalate dehydratase small subunit